MKILLTKEEVKQALLTHFGGKNIAGLGMGVIEVKITPYGEYVAELTLAEQTNKTADVSVDPLVPDTYKDSWVRPQ